MRRFMAVVSVAAMTGFIIASMQFWLDGYLDLALYALVWGLGCLVVYVWTRAEQWFDLLAHQDRWEKLLEDIKRDRDLDE